MQTERDKSRLNNAIITKRLSDATSAPIAGIRLGRTKADTKCHDNFHVSKELAWIDSDCFCGKIAVVYNKKTGYVAVIPKKGVDVSDTILVL